MKQLAIIVLWIWVTIAGLSIALIVRCAVELIVDDPRLNTNTMIIGGSAAIGIVILATLTVISMLWMIEKEKDADFNHLHLIKEEDLKWPTREEITARNMLTYLKSQRTEGAYRYPMCQDQLAQIDCRRTTCHYWKKGACTNISPAITLNPHGGGAVCWSFNEKKKDEKD
jgi:hypothetical protein